MISLSNRLILGAKRPRFMSLVTSGGYLPGDFVLSASSTYSIPSGFTLLSRDTKSRTVSSGGESEELSIAYCISYKIYTASAASLPSGAVRSVHLRETSGALATSFQSSGAFNSTDYASPVAVVSWAGALDLYNPVSLPSLSVSGADKIKDYYIQYDNVGGNSQYVYGAVRAQAFCASDGDMRPDTYTLPSASWRVVYGV